MALLDLSLVTTTLLRLLRARVDPLWATFFPPVPPPPVINYTGVSSAVITGDQAIGMFLYYASEDPHFKNLPPAYRDHPPVRFTPMGVVLQYQLDRKSTRLNSSHSQISYAVFCMKKKNNL